MKYRPLRKMPHSSQFALPIVYDLHMQCVSCQKFACKRCCASLVQTFNVSLSMLICLFNTFGSLATREVSWKDSLIRDNRF